MVILNKLDMLMLTAKWKINHFLKDEEGDTNFISIIVLLGIALALAGAFMAFKDQIMDWVNEQTSGFFNNKGGTQLSGD